MTAVPPPPPTRAPPPTQAPPSVQAKRRVPFWDTARFVAVALVVVGHGIQRLTGDSDSALILYLFIYGFHVPAFALISGYFSKADAPTSIQMRKVVTELLLPYLIMETIWSFVQFVVEGRQDFNPTKPSWTLWFLLALGIFRLVLPYLALVRWPLLWAVVLSVGVGYFDNVDNTFSLSRTIGLLPFFVLGWMLRERGLIDRWRLAERVAGWVRAAAASVLAGWLVVVAVFIEQFREIQLQHWLFYDDSYRAIGEDRWWAGLVRLGFLLLAVLLSAAFFLILPRSETWMTGFGQATMYVYLLHTFVLYPVRETGVLGGEHSSDLWLASMVLASIGISIALASPLVRKVFRPLVEPRPHWLFAEDARR